MFLLFFPELCPLYDNSMFCRYIAKNTNNILIKPVQIIGMDLQVPAMMSRNCLREKNRLEFDCMDEILQRLVRDNFSELAGLRVDASIPVPERLVNEIVGTAIRGNKNINYCRISISHQNRVSVNLKTPLWPWPLELKLRLDRIVDFRRSPLLRAKLENKTLLGRLGSFFKVLPDGLHISGDQVIVDLRAFLLVPEQKKYLELIKTAEIKTEEAKVIIDITAAVSGHS